MPAVPSTLTELTALRRDLAAPLITYYDMSTGERVELSGTTTANWVAKTSNLLVDDLDASPGTRIRIGLPMHWLRCVWLLASWNVGATVVDRDAAIGISGPDLVGDEPHRLASSLRPLGGRFVTPPGGGFLDLALEVPGHSDYYQPFDVPAPDTLALDILGTPPATHADLLQVGPDSRRVLVGSSSVVDDARRLVAACLGQGSVVLVASATPDEITRIANQESAEPVSSIP